MVPTTNGSRNARQELSLRRWNRRGAMSRVDSIFHTAPITH